MVRSLIVPRVIAITAAGTILALLAVFCIEFFEFLMNTVTVHQTFGAQLSTVQLSFSTYDLFASVGKHLIIGFFIGVVACYKGLNARGGAEGVGRAINQTVVISFFGLWLIDIIWNTAYLTLFPRGPRYPGLSRWSPRPSRRSSSGGRPRDGAAPAASATSSVNSANWSCSASRRCARCRARRGTCRRRCV